MQFSVTTPAGELLTYGADCSFDISDHGVLVVQDTEANEQLTLSPVGWTGVTEELPAREAPPLDQ